MRRSIAVCAVTLCACGSGGISIDEYLDQKATADTNALVCELGVAPEYVGFLPEAFQQEFEREQLRRAVASGRAKYDGRKAKVCLDQSPFRNPANCWGPSAPLDLRVRLRAISHGGRPSECAQVFTGSVADGGACYLDADCANEKCLRDTCPGRCAHTVPPGAPCRAYDFCPPPNTGFTVCDVCPAGTRCTPNGVTLPTCQPPGLPKSTGAACFYDDECQSGLLCLAGHCSTGLASGGSCGPTDDNCGLDLYCNPTDPSQSTLGTCAARLDAGATCDDGGFQINCALPIRFYGLASLSCKGNQMCAGVVRDSKGQVIAQGHCAAPQGVGAPCARPATGSPDPGTMGCSFGLVCDPATSKCARPPPAGQPCVDGICDWGTAYCNACGGTCQSKKADGQPCQVPDECQPSSLCDFGTCAPLSSAICREP